MYDKINLKLPIFEMGLKGYLYGKKALEFAKAADDISKKYDVSIIFDPQYVDIPKIVEETENLYIFAQHMDPIEIGRGVGSILPEALKEVGAVGTILNHSERMITLSHIYRSIKRADDIGLATLVCTDSPKEAAAMAYLNPNIVLAEPPDLIATGKSVTKVLKNFISETISMVKEINPNIIIGCGAGIKDAEDVKEIIKMGAELTGSTSAILKSDNPAKKLEEMVAAMKEAWLQIN